MAPRRRSYDETGEFFGPGWRSGPVRKATKIWSRWRGLRPRSNNRGLWLTGSSVHGFGMRETLWVCGLDENRIVVDTRKLPPGAIVTIRRANSLLELPGSRRPPPLGSHLTWIDARDVDPLRHSDR